MKVRHRNSITGELRDVEADSDEEATMAREVYSVKGVSSPLWPPLVERDPEEVAKEARELAGPTDIMFGGSGPIRQGVTAAEFEMGIQSYEQKQRELGLIPDSDPDEEEDDDDSEEEDDASSTSGAGNGPKRSTSPRRRRTGASGAGKAA
jgi:hypothetical protein